MSFFEVYYKGYRELLPTNPPSLSSPYSSSSITTTRGATASTPHAARSSMGKTSPPHAAQSSTSTPSLMSPVFALLLPWTLPSDTRGTMVSKVTKRTKRHKSPPQKFSRTHIMQTRASAVPKIVFYAFDQSVRHAVASYYSSLQRNLHTMSSSTFTISFVRSSRGREDWIRLKVKVKPTGLKRYVASHPPCFPKFG